VAAPKHWRINLVSNFWFYYMTTLKCVIGSRGSKLALWQSEWVKSRLEALDPQLQVTIEIIKTSGDKLTDLPLSVIGGKGVFTKELEEALLVDHVDIAVHSLKDLPTVLPSGLTIGAICEREDVRDALVLPLGSERHPGSLGALPRGSKVGSSSPRRMAQLRRLRPDVSIAELRGNVDTRLRKLDKGEYDAVILAAAGLRRLGLSERISAAFDVDEMLPAVGQGALGLEIREGDDTVAAIVSKLEHQPTRAACTAERALLRGLGGGCQLPIAGHATVEGGTIRLRGMVATATGDKMIREQTVGRVEDAESIGKTLAELILNKGAATLLPGF
jgi:hydroxymethylbilane synthase